MAIKQEKAIIIFFCLNQYSLYCIFNVDVISVLVLLLLPLSVQCDVKCANVNTENSFILMGSYTEAGNEGCKCHINVSIDRGGPNGTNSSLVLTS